MTLRQLILDPPLQMIMLIATGWVISENFSKLQGTVHIPGLGLEMPAPLLPAVIIAIALFSPYLSERWEGTCGPSAGRCKRPCSGFRAW